MKRLSLVTLIILGMTTCVLYLSLLNQGNAAMATAPQDKQLVHNVFFTLKDGTPENVQRLVDACHRYLKGHAGEIFFAAGGLVHELDRPVNQRDFHVALCIVFKSRQAHDEYQVHPRHLKFIEENKDTWAQVRVFDSWDR